MKSGFGTQRRALKSSAGDTVETQVTIGLPRSAVVAKINVPLVEDTAPSCAFELEPLKYMKQNKILIRLFELKFTLPRRLSSSYLLSRIAQIKADGQAVCQRMFQTVIHKNTKNPTAAKLWSPKLKLSGLRHS